MGFFKRKPSNTRLPDPIPVPPPPPPSMKELLGVNVGSVRDELPFLTALGIRHVRLACYLDQLDDPRPHPQFLHRTYREDFIADCELLRFAAIDTLIVFHSSPDLGSMPSRIAGIAASIPWITRFQLHNEQNIESLFRPELGGGSDQHARGEDYALLYKRTKQLLPNHFLLAGGLAGNPSAFLEGMAHAGCQPDGLALHCYGYPPYHQMVDHAALAREVYPSTPLYCTEVGSEGGRTDERKIQQDLDGVIHTIRTSPRLFHRTYWFTLSSTIEYGYGLVLDGVPRSAYSTFSQALR